jgi:hypothetical protein
LLTIPVGISWDGVEAVRRLHEIYLCDVVNWNTYAILSQAGQRAEENMSESWLLTKELSASTLTRTDLLEKSIEEIFVKTALGKLVTGMLGIWSERGVAEHSIEQVKVIFDSNRHEFILGECRIVMDVVITLSSADGRAATANDL